MQLISTAGRLMVAAALCVAGDVMMGVAGGCAWGAVGAMTDSLPAGYTPLEWVESTGGQYIDTLYKMKADDKVQAVMEVRREQPGHEATAFGAQPPLSPWNDACTMDVCMNSTGVYRFWRASGRNFSGRNNIFYGRKIVVEMDGAGYRWKPAAESAWTENLECRPTGDCAQSLYVFAAHVAAGEHADPRRFGALKLHSLAIASAEGTPRRTSSRRNLPYLSEHRRLRRRARTREHAPVSGAVRFHGQ